MREIVFRGQTRKFGEKIRVGDSKPLPGKWAYGGICWGEGCYSIIYGSTDFSSLKDKHVVYTDTVGQYTGLNDKNGQKIFEGDILTIDTLDQVDDGERFEVYWRADCYLFSAKSKHFEYDLWQLHQEEIKVIGSIWDNPDLKESAHE